MNKTIQKRIGIVFMFIIFAIMLLVAKISYIKVAKGKEYEKRAQAQQFNKMDRTVLAKRGNIRDVNGNNLVISKKAYNIIMDPKVLRVNHKYEEEELEEKLTLLSDVVKVDLDTLKEYTKLNSNYKKIYIEATEEEKQIIDDLNIAGIWFEEEYIRNYLYDSFASHLIGVKMNNAAWGLEKQYDSYLAGTDGRTLAMFDNNNYILQSQIEPVNGYDVYLTIDKNIQHFTEIALSKSFAKHKAKSISAIAMKPNTGEVIAMASYPTYNPNKPYTFEEEKTSEELYSIWKNPLISNTYEPGSTFKAIVMAAALEEKVIDETDTFYCPGHKEVYDRKIHCWKRTGHGHQTLEEALMNSCNVAMMEIVEKMERDIFYKYQKGFGFGEYTGIDLIGEENAKALLHKKEKLGPVELATGSFGQRFNVTPIQMLNAMASLVNGGELYRPYIVEKITDSKSNVIKNFNPKVVRTIVSKETSETLKRYMESVVKEGTGKAAYIDGYRVGGKTATSEKGTSGEIFILSFIGFAPVENPEIIVLVLIDEPEEGTDGGSIATPVVKEILGKSLEYYGVPKEATVEDDLIKKISIANYINYKKETAKEKMENINLEYEIIGDGEFITSQFPMPGVRVPENTKIYLYAEKKLN